MEDQQIFEKWEIFKSLLKSTNREGVDSIIKWLDGTDFKFAPASSQYHNAIRGGLLDHSLNVYYHMHDICNINQFFDLPEDSIIITSLLHDVCKVEFYTISTKNKKDENGQWHTVPYYAIEEKRAWGHGSKSVIELLKHGLKLNDIEITLILNHMGFSDTDNNIRVSKSFGQCPQSLTLYIADMLATYITESTTLPTRFHDKLVGRNINECLQKLKNPTTITINNIEYKIAPEDAVVDNEKIIYVQYSDSRTSEIKNIKVFAPEEEFTLPF